MRAQIVALYESDYRISHQNQDDPDLLPLMNLDLAGSEALHAGQITIGGVPYRDEQWDDKIAERCTWSGRTNRARSDRAQDRDGAMYRQLTPTSQLIAESAWPTDLLPLDDVSALLDAVSWWTTGWYRSGGGLQAGIRLMFAGELALRLAGLDGVALVFGVPAVPLPVVPPPPPPPDPDGLTRIPGPQRRQEFIPDDSLADGWTEVSIFLDVDASFGWSARLHDVTVALRLDSGLLRPADGSDHVSLTTRGDIALDSTFDLTVSGFTAVDLSPCEIGDTGLILAATGVKSST